ncbi:MAG: sulfatase-like hydrolase/transferase [Sphaerochaetaceae bacterium]
MRPNIIIVMTDQQRYDLRKAVGFPLDTMPFLDAWSKGGVDFTKAYTSNPTCMPARVSMLTGRYSESHHVRTNHNVSDVTYTLDLLDILKKEGYATALCGKNHAHRAAGDYDYHDINGHLGADEPHRLQAHEQQLDDFLKSLNFIDSLEPSPGDFTAQLPYRNVTSTLNFIDNATEQRKPFFAWLSFAEPHNPYQVPEPYFSLFPPETLPSLATSKEDLQKKGEKFIWLRKIWEKVLGSTIESRIQRDRSNYLGMLRLIDDQFKRLVTGLEERGILDNTIIIFLSDHGDFMGEYGLVRKGPDLPDVLTHIPMVWKGPGIVSQGRLSDYFVNIVDIFPTLCDILGVEIPFGVQGKSIKTILEKSVSFEQKEFAVTYAESGFSGLYWNDLDDLTVQQEKACQNWDTFDCLNSWTQSGQIRMLCKGSYKIQVDMMGTGFLYNLDHDPMEVSNLWDDESYNAIKLDMLTELTAAILRACDPIPAPHNRYRTKLHPKGYWFDTMWHASDPSVKQIPMNISS